MTGKKRLADNIFAQHEETGRIWCGPLINLPNGYAKLSVQRSIGACESTGGHVFGPGPDPDGSPCLRGCGGVYQA